MRGLLFSIDALLASLILVGGLLVVSGISQHSSSTSQLSSASDDLLSGLSAVHISDMTDDWVAASIQNGSISDPNATVLEQIGYFWATNRTSEAQMLSTKLLDGIYPQLGLRLSIEGDQLYLRNGPGSSNLLVSTRMISGVAEGEALTGSSAVAYLRRIKDKRNAVFIPFGGFVGEGNVSVATTEVPSGANVTDLLFELDTQRAFGLYINNQMCDRMIPSGASLVPTAWNRTNCTSMIVPGTTNTFDLRFEGSLNGSSVAGGYVKVLYFTNQPNEINLTSMVYRFPQIDGLINLYDGFYVGGNVSAMNISLHFLSNYTSYLTIANASFTFAGSNVTQNVTLNTTQIQAALAAAGLSYDNMSLRTVPLRFGIGDVVISGTPSDIVIVSDTSGSMAWCVTDDGSVPCPLGDIQKINVSRNVTTSFVTRLLNGSSGTRVGLSEFADDMKSWNNLTSNLTRLVSQISGYTASGGTCICCGINNATASLNLEGQLVLIPRRTSGWKYNDSDLGSPPSLWNTTSFNTSVWKDGTTGIGWTYSGLNTVLSSSFRYDGMYLYRKTFNVTNASEILDAKLYVYSDDGADVYLNGARIDADYGNTHNAIYWNRDGMFVNASRFITGSNVIAVRQFHNGGSSNRMGFDLQLIANTRGNTTATQTKHIVIMTDGEATDTCSEQGTGNATADAIMAACDAYNDYGIVVHTVGFGLGADSHSLQLMANCTPGRYYSASNSTALENAFSSIASTIIDNSNTQTAIITGNVSRTILYSDSQIQATYVADTIPPQPNEISVTLQSPALAGCSADVTIYDGMRILDAAVTSYSGDFWTSAVSVNGVNVYNLSTYGTLFSSLGDPYRIKIPPSLLHSGNNSIGVYLGTDALNLSPNCSANNTLIYTVAINLSTERSAVVEGAQGCRWRIAFAGGSMVNLTIPTSYVGNASCSYVPGNISYDPTDAYQLGAYTIFNRLDFTRSGNLYVDLQAEDLEVIVTTISKVPYLWGPSIAKLEVSR